MISSAIKLTSLGVALSLFASSPVWANEPYLPPSSRSFTTWQQLYLDQLYETEKWWEASQGPYEQCAPSAGPTFITAYPRPDGLYCYYWSLFQHNRAIAWMIVNAGLTLHTLTCDWVGAQRLYPSTDVMCPALQQDFGGFGR